MTTPLLERPHRQIAAWYGAPGSALLHYGQTANITKGLMDEIFEAIIHAADNRLGGCVNDLNALLQFVHREITS